jgi:hypothetical protein
VKRLRGSIAGLAFAAVTLVAPSAYALNGAVAMTGVFVPSEFGADAAMSDGRSLPRFRFHWSNQLPLCVFVSGPAPGGGTQQCPDDHPLISHRIVYSFGFALGRASVNHDSDVAASFRIGHRYRFSHVGTTTAPYFGLGLAAEAWKPGSHAGLSAEAGVHFGPQSVRARLFSPGVTLGLRTDTFFVVEPRARMMALVGWTIL